jgi:aryl-alcohol dehydrogenase-like predicted oxidoreductase
MLHRRLGSSDLMVTPIGLGTWAIGGGDWMLGWGPQDVRDSIATIRRAVDAGINWIDTAAVFGLGHAETVIARALRGIPHRDRPYVFTRCGLVWDDLGNVSHDLSPASIRAQADASLRRLQTDAIDLFQIGWPSWPLQRRADDGSTIDAAWETLAALRQDGKVREIGIAGCLGPGLARIHRAAPVTSLSAPYSLLRREVEKGALPFCAEQGIGFLACSTLASGLLSGKMTEPRLHSLPCNDWRRRHPFFNEIVTQSGQRHARLYIDQLQRIAGRYGRTPAQIAIAGVLHHPHVTAAIVGARRPWQVDDAVSAAACALTRDDVAELIA